MASDPFEGVRLGERFDVLGEDFAAILGSEETLDCRGYIVNVIDIERIDAVVLSGGPDEILVIGGGDGGSVRGRPVEDAALGHPKIRETDEVGSDARLHDLGYRGFVIEVRKVGLLANCRALVFNAHKRGLRHRTRRDAGQQEVSARPR